MEERKVYIDKMKAQLKMFEADIQKLEARTEKVRLDLQSGYKKQIMELRERVDTMQKKVKDLSSSTDDAWAEMKKGLEKSWKELNKGFSKARSKY